MVHVASKFSKENYNSNQTLEPEKSQQQQDNQLQLNLTGQGNNIRIQVKSPNGVSKVNNSLCCVVDVSGSMSSLATSKTDAGSVELGYSVLDIVKHSLNTIVANLDENDHFSLVTFSNSAQEVLNVGKMTESSKSEVLYQIKKCYASGGTNIWGGIEKGLEVMKKDVQQDKHQQLIVLTDGQPNVNPPRGVLPTLTNYYGKEFLSRKPTINTFGFGYSMDSQLLLKMSQECQGNYSFIPDSSFVGTVFTNSIAAMQSTYATNATLIFKPLHSQAKLNFSQILSNFKVYMNNNGEICVELGNLLYDQSKDIIFSQSLKSELLKDFSVSVSYYKQEPVIGQMKHFQTATAIGNSNQLEFEQEQLRLDAIQAIASCKASNDSTINIISQMSEKLSSSEYKDNEYIKALYEDIHGQVNVAVSNPTYFEKWGQHYLPSLAMAHTHKFCTNFKDPGVQGYAGKLFSQQRDSIEKIFLGITPPEPSYKDYNTGPVSSAQYSSAYYSSSNPCFDGESEVQMADGTVKKVKHIKKDDLIFCPQTGTQERVKCVIETDVKSQLLPMVRIGNGLLITPYHPIKIQDKWVFPSDIAPVKLAKCPSVYSFLLESGHSMKINGVECVTFAHGFQENVVKHEYFGTSKIVQDLRWMKGYWSGHVKLNDSPAIRNSQTGLVMGLYSNRKWMANLQDIKYNQLNNFKNYYGKRLLQLTKKLIKI